MSSLKPHISIILPCRNEALALPGCLTKIATTIQEANLDAEVIVSDSSTDRSPEIAKEFGVVLVKHNKDGYGNAYLEAFKVAKGDYFFMADADGTYDFGEIPTFVKQLDAGYDFVIGNRFAGTIDAGAMPFAHRYVGNPLLSFLLRMFFKSKVRDVHCGMRAATHLAIDQMNLHAAGMEFASEMVIKAAKNKLAVKQLPINYHCRQGNSKLNPLADGWRHLRFMLLFSPLFLFFIPGLIFFLAGGGVLAFLYFGKFSIGGIHFQYHPMFLASLLTIIGYQLIIFAFFSKTYAITHLGETSRFIDWLNRHITIEKATLLAAVIFFLGMFLFLKIFLTWVIIGFGALQEVKNSILAMTVVVLAIQTFFSSFMLSILGIKNR